MSDPKPDPLVEKNGLPYCRDECALFDGKRCRATGFRPGTLCEPAVLEVLDGRNALKARVSALKARVAKLEGIREEQAAKLRRHLDEIATARDCYRAAREALEAAYCNAAAVMDPGALPDSETLGPEAGERAVVLVRAIVALAQDRAKLRAHLDNRNRAHAMSSAFLRDLRVLLDRGVLGHNEGKVITHRSITDADVIDWLNRLDEMKRRIDHYGDVEPKRGSCRCSCDESEERTRHAAHCPVSQPATTIDAPPPDDLLDRITPVCRHIRRHMRPSPFGVPVITCIDCGEDLSP